MASPKEQCFADALEAWEGATGKSLKIDLQQWWTKNAAGGWERASFVKRSWYEIVNSWKKTKRFLNGDTSTPAPGSVQGLRRPDITMPGANGKDMVVEIKFTNKEGKPDPWGDGQRESYQEINKQNQGPSSGTPVLDQGSCGCKGEPQPETVEVPVPALQPGVYFVPLPAPGGVPMPAPAPMPFPLRLPIPVFP